MMAHRGASGARTKRYTDELGEHWVKQFKQFAGAGANTSSTSYTGHSSGFRDSSVELPPPPVDASPPQAVTQMSEASRYEVKVRGSPETSHPSDLLHDPRLQQQKLRAEIIGSNSPRHAAHEHRSVAATPDCHGQVASSSEKLEPSETANDNDEPAPQRRGSSVQIQDGPDAAKLLQHQRLLGAPLVPPLTEMKPTELFIFPRGPHCMRPALATPNVTATATVEVGSTDGIH